MEKTYELSLRCSDGNEVRLVAQEQELDAVPTDHIGVNIGTAVSVICSRPLLTLAYAVDSDIAPASDAIGIAERSFIKTARALIAAWYAHDEDRDAQLGRE